MDQALYAVVMEAYTGGISTRKVDALVEALGGASGISKSEVSRICRGVDEQVKAFLSRPLEHARFPYVYRYAICPHGRLGRNLQVCSRALVLADRHQRPGLQRVARYCRRRERGQGF